MGNSLFDRLGGEAAIKKAVDIFYKHVMADQRINHFFKGVDMKKLAGMQNAFLTTAFGGPNIYTGRALQAAHARLVEQGLNDSHFDAVLDDLTKTLKELNVPDDLIQEAGKIADSVRNDVLGR